MFILNRLRNWDTSGFQYHSLLGQYKERNYLGKNLSQRK